MLPIPSICFLIKAVTIFWALLVLAVSAALQAKLHSDLGAGIVNNTNLAGANALIACAVFTMLYLVVEFFLQKRIPNNIVLSVTVEATILGFLSILALGGVGAESSEAAYFEHCGKYTGCDYGGLGKATIGLGWIFFFLLFGLFLFELIYTFMHFGASWTVWRTSFKNLLEDGAPRRPADTEKGTHSFPTASGTTDQMSSPAAPLTTTQGTTAGAQSGQGYEAQPAGMTYPPTSPPQTQQHLSEAPAASAEPQMQSQATESPHIQENPEGEVRPLPQPPA